MPEHTDGVAQLSTAGRGQGSGNDGKVTGLHRNVFMCPHFFNISNNYTINIFSTFTKIIIFVLHIWNIYSYVMCIPCAKLLPNHKRTFPYNIQSKMAASILMHIYSIEVTSQIVCYR